MLPVSITLPRIEKIDPRCVGLRLGAHSRKKAPSHLFAHLIPGIECKSLHLLEQTLEEPEVHSLVGPPIQKSGKLCMNLPRWVSIYCEEAI